MAQRVRVAATREPLLMSGGQKHPGPSDTRSTSRPHEGKMERRQHKRRPYRLKRGWRFQPDAWRFR